MTDKERSEHAKLLRVWATGRATMRQINRCMALDRKAVRDTWEPLDPKSEPFRNGPDTSF